MSKCSQLGPAWDDTRTEQLIRHDLANQVMKLQAELTRATDLVKGQCIAYLTTFGHEKAALFLSNFDLHSRL